MCQANPRANCRLNEHTACARVCVCKSASLQGGGFIITKAEIKKKKNRTDDYRHCVSQKAWSECKNATTESKEMETKDARSELHRGESVCECVCSQTEVFITTYLPFAMAQE